MNPDSVDQIPLTADLHIHSALSPCGSEEMLPPLLVKRLAMQNIQVFSITDHNSGANCRAFETVAKEAGLLFIPGIELQSSEEVHLLGYFPDVVSLESFCEEVVNPGLMQGMKNDPEKFGRQMRVNREGKLLAEVEDMLSMPLTHDAARLVYGIHDHGGIAVGAHLDRDFSLVSQLGFIPPDLPIDAVEIKDPVKIERFKKQYLADRPLPVLSSSDSHYLNDLMPPKMRFRIEKKTVGCMLECIKGQGNGRFTLIESGFKSTRRHVPASGDGWKNLYK